MVVVVPSRRLDDLESRRGERRAAQQRARHNESAPTRASADWTIVGDGEKGSRHRRVTVDPKSCRGGKGRGSARINTNYSGVFIVCVVRTLCWCTILIMVPCCDVTSGFYAQCAWG